MSSVREQLLAVSSPSNGCRPIPCPDCPVPGVFVAKLTAARFIDLSDELKRCDPDPANTNPIAPLLAKRNRIGVQLLYAAVDADGNRLFQSVDEALAVDADVAMPIIDLFNDLNGLSEKKSPPPNSPPAG